MDQYRRTLLRISLFVVLASGSWLLGRQELSAQTPGLPQVTLDALRLQEAFNQAAARVLPATVGVATDKGQGSGVVYDAKGLILTNDHVIRGAQQIRVKLADRRILPAKLLGTDRGSDIAVLQVASATPLPAAELGVSDDVKVGQWAIAIGNPLGLEQSVTIGVISAVGRHTGITGNTNQDYLQTDAAINPGNSGGPLVNILGQVIGVNNHIISDTGNYAGIGLAVPVDVARAVSAQIVSKGRVSRSALGLTIRDASPDEVNRVGARSGIPAVVDELVANGPAAQAGLQVGDLVLAVSGHTINGSADFANRIQLLPADQPVALAVWRQGQRLTLQAKPTVATLNVNPGAQFREITPELAAQMGVPNLRGVLVVGLERNGLLASAGVRRMQVITAVNGEPTMNLTTFQAAWQKAVQGPRVTLRVNGRDVVIEP
ncbi:MAG: trypsin-like peptidase domain-containing protein [Fimbriimonadaceae bacterium]|nr:trypsin-like peptidase domain-containing protein [Fimbriimonadaceae bacterium]